MANKFRAPGDKVQLTAGTTLASNDVVAFGSHGLVIASTAIASGIVGTHEVKGVFELAADNATAFVVGDKLYWDASGLKLYKTASSGYYFAGYAWQAKASSGTTAWVKLAPYAEEGRRHLTTAVTATLTAADFLSKLLTVTVSTAGTATLNLPAVATVPIGARVTLVKTGSAGAITLDGASSETINGNTTYAAADAQYDTATLENTGAAWLIVDRYIS